MSPQQSTAPCDGVGRQTVHPSSRRKKKEKRNAPADTPSTCLGRRDGGSPLARWGFLRSARHDTAYGGGDRGKTSRRKPRCATHNARPLSRELLTLRAREASKPSGSCRRKASAGCLLPSTTTTTRATEEEQGTAGGRDRIKYARRRSNAATGRNSISGWSPRETEPDADDNRELAVRRLATAVR